MGRKVLVLMVLGAVVVGIAIILFRGQAVAANSDKVTPDLVNLVARAQQHYRFSPSLGGQASCSDLSIRKRRPVFSDSTHLQLVNPSKDK